MLIHTRGVVTIHCGFHIALTVLDIYRYQSGIDHLFFYWFWGVVGYYYVCVALAPDFCWLLTCYCNMAPFIEGSPPRQRLFLRHAASCYAEIPSSRSRVCTCAASGPSPFRPIALFAAATRSTNGMLPSRPSSAWGWAGRRMVRPRTGPTAVPQPPPFGLLPAEPLVSSA